MDDTVRAALRRSAINYAEKHPEDIPPRLETLCANMARLERKAKRRGLSPRAEATLAENRFELGCLSIVATLFDADTVDHCAGMALAAETDPSGEAPSAKTEG